MHIDTPNARAFELAGEALLALDSFQQTKERKYIETATHYLQKALKEDPKYLRAIYYMGLAQDLIGRPKDAVKNFTEVLHSLEGVSHAKAPAFPIEVRYNLGTAYYHCYSKEELWKAAEEYFTPVTEQAKDRAIRNLAYASLAQTYAQLMIHRTGAQRYEKKAKAAAEKAVNDIWNKLIEFFPWHLYSTIERETLWITYNARGLIAMYRSDDFSDFQTGDRSYQERMKDLQEAKTYFETALRYSTENWAIKCNLGSAHMRQGYWMKKGEKQGSEKEFDAARKALSDVIDITRPDYGFALYERGRTYRLQGLWKEAIEDFKKALNIEDSSRNVSNERIQREIGLAENQDNEFLLKPLP